MAEKTKEVFVCRDDTTETGRVEFRAEVNADNDEILRYADVYNKIVENAVLCSRYRQAAELLAYDFIDAYDISLHTKLPYDEVKCIQAHLKFRR